MMSAEKLARFSDRKYLNLVTYRRSGAAVPTPLWFVEEGGVLYVRTPAKSGKVKRLRDNPRVRVAPSDGRGNPKGAWVDGRARVVVDGAEAERANRLVHRKYGWRKKLIELRYKLNPEERVTIAVHVG
jgi:PPOX class probable F420-dependent enzyme